MRELIKQFIEICAETLPISDPVYEFGSLQVAGQEGFADLRPFFPGKRYVGADMREGPGVDVILNLHHIDLPSESVGTVLIMDTLEHVEFPHRALEEAYRIIRPNGMVIISSVMNFPVHDYPFDYWRFTPEAFKSILRPFSQSIVGFAGDEGFPHTVVGVGFKGSPFSLALFMSKYEQWKHQWGRSSESKLDHGEALRVQLEDLQSQLATLRLSTEEKDRLITEFNSRLLALQGTIGWKVLERFRRVRDRLLPLGSHRRTAYGTLHRILQVLLDEGPYESFKKRLATRSPRR